MPTQSQSGTTLTAPHASRHLSSSTAVRRVLGLTALGAVLSAAPASAQTTFSIDYKGPTSGMVTEGDILMPAPGFPALGPLPLPPIVLPGGGGPGSLGLVPYGGCVGHPPGIACGVEVDALSYGFDFPAQPAMPPGSYYFSVESLAAGFPTGFPAPDVMSESGVAEAGADVFADLGLAAAPLPPFASPPGNAAVIDGDGLAFPSPFTYPGLGLIEPTSGGCVLPEPGDNVDAVDVDGPFGFPVYFSLDAGFLDVPCGFPLGGSAAASGTLPGDVLMAAGGGLPPFVWIPAPAMGLDLFGPGTDDLDALAIWENGTGVWENAGGPYGWLGGADMVIFSVREGSAIIGTPDSLLGVPIEAGDLLIPPAFAGMPPQMYIAAENIGLATVRSGFGAMDDLDALDILQPTISPLDPGGVGGGIPVNVLIALGLLPDCNGNLVPDVLEFAKYCTAGTSASGCMPTLCATGTASATATSGFTVSAAAVEGSKDGLFFYGTNGRQANPWGSGTSFQCVVPPVKRGGLLTGSGTIGACDGSFMQDLNARWCPTCPKPTHNPGAGAVVQLQLWYRDPFNTSNQTTSLSDALEFVTAP